MHIFYQQLLLAIGCRSGNYFPVAKLLSSQTLHRYQNCKLHTDQLGLILKIRYNMQLRAYKHTLFIPVLVIIGNYVTLFRNIFLIHTHCGMSGRIPLLNEKRLRHFGR